MTKQLKADGVEAIALTGATIVLSALTLGAYMLLRGGAGSFSFPKGEAFRDIGISAVASSCIAQFFLVLGLSMTSVTNANILLVTNAAWTALLASAVNKDILGKNFWKFSIVMAIGAVLVSTNGSLTIPNLGDLLLLCTAIGFAFGHVYAKRAMKTCTSDQVTFWRFLFASVLFIPVVFIFGNASTLFSSWDIMFRITVAGVLFAANVAAFYKAIKLDGPALCATISDLSNPLIAVLFGVFLFGAAPTVSQLFGGALVVGGGYAISREDSALVNSTTVVSVPKLKAKSSRKAKGRK